MKITVKHHDNKTFYINPKLANELKVALYAVKHKNQDLVIVIDGPEGAGKSVMARQIGYYCAQIMGSPFDVDGVKNIHNDIDKYIRTSATGKRLDVNILDESRKILNKRRSMGKDAVRFTNYLSECRSMNQVHIILLPAFHDLDRYVAQWRMSFLIHVYKLWVPSDNEVKVDLQLGNYKVYMNDMELRTKYDLFGFQYPRSYVIRDRFSGFEVLSTKGLKAYEDQKGGKIFDKYVKEIDEKDKPKPTQMGTLTHKYRAAVVRAMDNLKKDHNITNSDYAEALGFTRHQLSMLKREVLNNGLADC